MVIQKHNMELNEETDLRTIINNFSSHTDKVKFAFFCAKDCFHLNNEYNKPFDQHCITLVESWIINPHSVSNKQLIDAAYANSAYGSAAYAAFCAININAVYNVNAAAVNTAYRAANIFHHAYFYDNIAVGQKKLNQYTHYALSLLRTTTTTNLQTKGKIQDKVTLMALLDELNDNHENLILHENNTFTLNHPTNITTITLPELVDLIWSNQSLLHYLEHLYGNHTA